MDAMKTHGVFSWSELQTNDLEAAKDFYGSVLGWTLQSEEMPTGEYVILKVGDTMVGGMVQACEAGRAPVWVSYVTVDDVDARANSAVEQGGKVVNPPMDIPEVGRIAAISDPQGAVIYLIKYAEN